MQGQDSVRKPENSVDRRSSIHFGTASTSSPMAMNGAPAQQGMRSSFSAVQGLRQSQLGRIRDSSLEDDAVSTTSGYTTSHADNSSRRESMADSIVAVEDVTGAGLLQMGDMGIAPAVIEGTLPPTWSGNGLGTGIEPSDVMALPRPGFPTYQVDGTITHRAPSLSDVKDAWRQFAAGQQPISIGGLVPGPQTRPPFIHRARSNSVPEVFPKHLVDLAVTHFALTTPRAEAESFNFNPPAPIVASPADLQAGSSSPASVVAAAAQSGASKPQSMLRGSSGNSSISMVDAILPASSDVNNNRAVHPPRQDQGSFAMLPDREGQIPQMNPPASRPSIAVFQPTAGGNVARHILLQGGSQTLAPERPPSFLNASFIDTDRNKFKVPGFAGQTGFYAQPIMSTKMSSLAARPGNKRLPSQTLGPDYQKKMPVSMDFGHPSPLANLQSPSLLNNIPAATNSHARRYSVPGWLGGTPYGTTNEFIDSESSFLQAAFPGTMAVPELTPTQNPLLAGFPFPVPSYT